MLDYMVPKEDIMRLLIVLLFTATTFSQQWIKSSQKIAPQELQSCKESLARLHKAIDNLVTNTKDQQAKYFSDVLKNSACAVLTNEAGRDKQAVRYMEMPNDKNRPFVGVVFVAKQSQIPEGFWKKFLTNSKFIAQYFDGINTIIFREDMPQVPVLYALIAMHEMQHFWQRTHPLDRKIPDFDAFRELFAYEYEFHLLDRLNLRGLKDLIAAERARIRPYVKSNQGFNTNFDNPALERVFGPMLFNIQRQNAASIVMMRSLFAEFEALYPQKVALQKKMYFLKTQTLH